MIERQLAASILQALQVFPVVYVNGPRCGVVLYRGNKIVPFEENMWAVPVDAVWA